MCNACDGYRKCNGFLFYPGSGGAFVSFISSPWNDLHLYDCVTVMIVCCGKYETFWARIQIDPQFPLNEQAKRWRKKVHTKKKNNWNVKGFYTHRIGAVLRAHNIHSLMHLNQVYSIGTFPPPTNFRSNFEKLPSAETFLLDFELKKNSVVNIETNFTATHTHIHIHKYKIVVAYNPNQMLFCNYYRVFRLTVASKLNEIKIDYGKCSRCFWYIQKKSTQIWWGKWWNWKELFLFLLIYYSFVSSVHVISWSLYFRFYESVIDMLWYRFLSCVLFFRNDSTNLSVIRMKIEVTWSEY